MFANIVLQYLPTTFNMFLFSITFLFYFQTLCGLTIFLKDFVYQIQSRHSYVSKIDFLRPNYSKSFPWCPDPWPDPAARFARWANRKLYVLNEPDHSLTHFLWFCRFMSTSRRWISVKYDMSTRLGPHLISNEISPIYKSIYSHK
jgi:hypothetical protein